MMRPIFLQLSDTYMDQEVRDIERCLYGGWSNRYRCINLNLNCPIPETNSSGFGNMRSRVHCPVDSVSHAAFQLFKNYTKLTNQTIIDSIDASLKLT